MKTDLEHEVGKLIAMLVRGDYAGIERITRGARLTAREIEDAVRDYGKTLKLPPDGHLILDSIRVVGTTPPTWSVRCELWTEEEGRSDLTLELTVIENADGATVELDNLHAL